MFKISNNLSFQLYEPEKNSRGCSILILLQTSKLKIFFIVHIFAFYKIFQNKEVFS